MGFEPTTSALGRLHSATELRPQDRASDVARYATAPKPIAGKSIAVAGRGYNFRSRRRAAAGWLGNVASEARLKRAAHEVRGLHALNPPNPLRAGGKNLPRATSSVYQRVRTGSSDDLVYRRPGSTVGGFFPQPLLRARLFWI